MKKSLLDKNSLLLSMIGIALICAGVTAGCASLGKKNSDAIDTGGPYYEEEHGGAGIRLVVMQPVGIGLNERDTYLLDLIQGSLNEDFNKYSAMTLLNRRDLDQILAEQELSAGGNFSDENYIAIGKLTNSQYMVTGSLTAVSRREFNLSLTISDAETAEVTATKNLLKLTALDIKRGAIKEATAYFLEKMNVVLTPAGKSILAAEALASSDAQARLAMSRVAGRSGNTVEELIYAYSAKDRNASLLEADDQLKSAAKEMSSGGLGEELKLDVERREGWKSRLVQFETYFHEYAPFEFFYTPALVQKGETNYEAAGGASADFEFLIGLQSSRELPIMQKVLKMMIRDLSKTGNRKKWGFNEWPQLEIENDLYLMKKHTIVAGIFNDNDEEIRTVPIELYTHLVYKSNNIYFDSSRRVPVVIKNVVVNDLTRDMKIRLISIDGIDALDAEADGKWVINAVDAKKFPRGKNPTIPEKQRTVPLPQEDIPEYRNADVASANALSNKKAQETYTPPKPEKPIEPHPLSSRFGLSLNAMFFPTASISETGAAVTLDLGIKSFAMEGHVLWPIDTGLYNRPDEAAVNPVGGGGGMGYTFLTSHLLSTLTLGLNYIKFNGAESVFAPYALLKFDIMPWKSGLGLRLGFMAEAGSTDWGDAYRRYFNEQWAFTINETFRINGKIMTGLVLWL